MQERKKRRATGPVAGAHLFFLAWGVLAWVFLALYLPAYFVHSATRGATRRERLARLKDHLGGGLGGDASWARSPTPLIWIHAVSVGELNAVLPLLGDLRASYEARFLVTTTTISSARTARRSLPEGAVHRFLPLDHPLAVRRFLRLWRPRAALMCEGEIWPALCRAAVRRGVPVVLVSARMSPRSRARWNRHPWLARAVFSLPEAVLARSESEVAAWRALGARAVHLTGDLKDAAAAPSHDAEELARLAPAFSGRARWAAISVHVGEVAAVLEAHRSLSESHPDLLTLLCPRRPLDRALQEIVSLLESSGLRFWRRGAGERPPAFAADARGGVYLADTFGEVGLWCRLVPAVFVGGSLIAHGGHNLREPAWLGAALFGGPSFFNQSETAAALEAAGALRLVSDGASLAAAVSPYLHDAGAAGAAARAYVRGLGESAKSETLGRLAPILEAQGVRRRAGAGGEG